MSQPTIEQLLEFERDHPAHGYGKEELIRSELHVAPARFYQLLGRAIQTEDALRFDAELTHRLRRKSAAALEARQRRIPGPTR